MKVKVDLGAGQANIGKTKLVLPDPLPVAADDDPESLPSTRSSTPTRRAAPKAR